MELTIEQFLQQGVAAHKERKFEEAERIYHAILQFQTLHPDTNHNLGLITVKAALPLFKTALKVNPKIEQFWLSYIDVLIKEKQFANAKQVLEQAKGKNSNSLSPSKSQVDNLLEHYQNWRYDEAEKLAIKITQEFPRINLTGKCAHFGVIWPPVSVWSGLL